MLNPWKCLVFSYGSTAFLHSLALNIPTFAFFQYGLGDIRQEALPFYRKLLNNSIIFEDPKECAFFISSNWNNLKIIWNSPNVQAVRKAFCDQFCKQSRNPVRDLYAILKKECSFENTWN